MKYQNQRINAIKQRINKHVRLIDVACELLKLDLNSSEDVIEQASRFIIFSPFRDDGSKPSFHIFKENNRWVDRASNESGDIFDFVMRVKECSFYHSFTFLAHKAGVEIADLTASFDDDPRTKIEAVMNFVVNACANELKSSEEVLNMYCEESGISDIDIIRYRVGYCPSRDWLVNKICSNFQEITDNFLSSIGLMKAERLEGAIVFPIVSIDGSYNRIYTKPRNKANKDDPKYWGQYFVDDAKKHVDDGALFGLSAVRAEVKRTKHVKVCEGYKQAMATGGVAIMGTRFSEKQVQTLHKMGVEKITIIFDGDDPGKEATFSLMSRSDIIDRFECRVVPLPKGKQADDILRDDGSDVLEEKIQQSVPLFDFVLDGSLDVSDPENYQDCLYATARMAHKLNPAHIFYLAGWFADRFKVPVEPIRDWLFTNVSNDTDTQIVKNPQAETDLCVYVARDSSCLDIARLDGVKTTMFTSFICRTIFEIVQRCYDFIGDAYTVQNVLDFARTNKEWEKFYTEISSTLSNDHKFKYEPDVASKLVVSCNSRRGIKSSMLELLALAGDLSFDYNAHIDQVLTRVTDGTNKNPLPSEPEDVVAAAEKRIEEAKANSNGVLGYDISCISPTLNQNLSGICKYTYTVLGGQTGCHSKGQEILMYDGSIKLVEDVEVGDQLMGPDSKPREVLSLARGREQMVDIVPVKGECFRVNINHILTLVRTDTGEIKDVKVSDYLSWSKRQKHLWKLFRFGVNFNSENNLHVPPYIVGALLGDGRLDASTPSIYSLDEQVIREFESLVGDFILSLSPIYKNGKDITGFYLSDEKNSSPNRLSNKLRHHNMMGMRCSDKSVPFEYKTASRDVRLEVLAGLIDTDGSLNCEGYDFISKSEQLAKDVVFLARSLGLAAYVKKCKKGIKSLNFTGDYWRVSISGDCSIIPVRIPYKKAKLRKQKKNVLRTGFKIVKVNEEDYYGFSLSGDGRFLLGDFTVTHNTGKSLLAANLIRPLVFRQKLPFLWINLEMDPMSLAFRFWAMESGLSETSIKLGRITDPKDIEALETAKKTYRESNLFIDKPANPTPEAVYALIRKYHNERGIAGVAMDYIQLVASAKSNEGREEVIGRMSKLFMNDVTQNMGLPVIAVSQQNRDRSASRTAEGIGGSYQIAQDAHNLVLISKADHNDPSVPAGANRIVNIAKARNAPDGLDFAASFQLEDPDNLRYSDFVQLPVS